MAKDSDNHRLSAALEVAKRTRPSRKRGFTPQSASDARRAFLASRDFSPTVAVRIHADAIEAARAAWPNRHDRVAAISDAIRQAAQSILSPGNP